MRIQVCLDLPHRVILPVSQNYFLASTIYNVLSARPDYAAFLHDSGYTHLASGRRFKLFVFGPIQCRQRVIQGETVLLGPGKARWIICSPMSEFVTAFAEGLLSRGELEVRGAKLQVETIESLPEPQYQSEMSFSCLSPIVVTRPRGEGEYAKFLTYEDEDFSERIRLNLVRKYELVHGHRPQNDRFEMTFDEDYIARRGGKVTKLIDIRGIQIRGVLAPFNVKGSTELIRIGCECGMGERNSMGFGAVSAE